MNWIWLVVVAWTIISPLIALLVAALIRWSNGRGQLHGTDVQCGYQFDTGQRCQWFNGHPDSWGHQWDSPNEPIVMFFDGSKSDAGVLIGRRLSDGCTFTIGIKHG